MIQVRFLGTAASQPTVARNVSAIAVQRDGETILWDCGEGTQRQIMRFRVGFAFSHIFITHAHADHFLGLPGLLRTMGLQGREDGLTVYGPSEALEELRAAVLLGSRRLPFPVDVKGLQAGDKVEFADWLIASFPADHGVPALGYALIEEARPGRFDVELARELGVPEGPLFGKLHRGETVEVNGKVISGERLVGEPRPGRKVVYSGDSRPAKETTAIAAHADLLIHEATFGEDEPKRARKTKHSTATEAARVAAQAKVRRLALTHISARYSDSPEALEAQASAVFPGAKVARDGLKIKIGYRDDA